MHIMPLDSLFGQMKSILRAFQNPPPFQLPSRHLLLLCDPHFSSTIALGRANGILKSSASPLARSAIMFFVSVPPYAVPQAFWNHPWFHSICRHEWLRSLRLWFLPSYYVILRGFSATIVEVEIDVNRSTATDWLLGNHVAYVHAVLFWSFCWGKFQGS